MTTKEVKDLIKLINESDLAEFKYKSKDVELRIRSKEFYLSKGKTFVSQPMNVMQNPYPQGHAVQPAGHIGEPTKSLSTEEDEPVASNLIEIKSPMVGTFYRSPAPDKPPFVSVGDNVEPGKVVCIIEAMKLFNEIESEVSGKIVKVMVEDASPVEYDQVIFLVEP